MSRWAIPLGLAGEETDSSRISVGAMGVFVHPPRDSSRVRKQEFRMESHGISEKTDFFRGSRPSIASEEQGAVHPERDGADPPGVFGTAGSA